jgi:hypothetical protein
MVPVAEVSDRVAPDGEDNASVKVRVGFVPDAFNTGTVTGTDGDV